MSNILQRDGLTIELLGKLSYKSELGINLKKNLHYFDKEKLFAELVKANDEDSVGLRLRKMYENAKIQSEQEFKEALKHVLSDC